MQYVYLLKSLVSKRKYIGCTNDLKNRILQHNKGLVPSTKFFRPWKIIYYEAFYDKVDAFKREKELKSEYTKKRHLLERLENSLKNS
jgi:putative endonuclease